MNKKDEKYLLTFTNNLNESILYYKCLFLEAKNAFQDIKELVLIELDKNEKILSNINLEIQSTAVLN